MGLERKKNRTIFFGVSLAQLFLLKFLSCYYCSEKDKREHNVVFFRLLFFFKEKRKLDASLKALFLTRPPNGLEGNTVYRPSFLAFDFREEFRTLNFYSNISIFIAAFQRTFLYFPLSKLCELKHTNRVGLLNLPHLKFFAFYYYFLPIIQSP